MLDEDHYDLDKVKERIVEYLAVQKLKARQSATAQIKGPILCFVGPPGVGKTSLGQSIARAMNRKFVRISLGGVRDEAEIRGHRRTYIGAIPGRIVQALKQAGAMNPVFMLDEIDKISAGFQGDPAAALLEVLDPAQNHSFRDHYLEINVDLSRVLFIATANQLGTIHPALLDRMEIISLAGYTEEEKLHIARQYLIPRQLEEHGLTPEPVVDRRRRGAAHHHATTRAKPASATSSARSARSRARSRRAWRADARRRRDRAPTSITAAGMPGLSRPAADPRRGVVPRVASRRRHRRRVDRNRRRRAVHRSAACCRRGHRQPDPHRPARQRDAGIGARGGQPHPVARRRSSASPPEFLDTHDLHIHVPAGAIPKDGPSAGVTMATAIVSALENQPVREDVAMTGEITLSGLVLPVGGIREKALAARRHGIKTFILPARNEARPRRARLRGAGGDAVRAGGDARASAEGVASLRADPP